MATNTEVRDLIRKRAGVRTKITIFAKYVAACEEGDISKIHDVRIRVAKLDKEYEGLETVQELLESLASDAEYEMRATEGAEIQEAYLNSVARAHQLISVYEKQIEREEMQQRANTAAVGIASTRGDQNGISQSPFTIDQEMHVKLPTMHLPKFGGSYEAWPGFCDAFKAAVHDNVHFRDAQKLIYLRSCLTGKAAEKIESLETTAANYSVAWNLLQKYYDDPSIIITNRIQALFELPSCARYNVNSLGELVDQATKQYRALQALNRPFLEAFPIYAVTVKLDDRTRLQWKEKIAGNSVPSMDDLLEFLHERRKLLETTNCERSHKPVTQTSRLDSRVNRQITHSQPTRAYPVTNISCQLCQDKHFTYRCAKLTNSNINQRIEIIRNAGLCTNCLRPHHTSRNCTASTCRQCNGKHHTLLHRELQAETQNTVHANVSALKVNGPPQVLLSTAVVLIRDNQGKKQACRLLLDSGSQSHFLTERCAKRLGLTRQQVKIPVIGINQNTTFISNTVKARIYSRITRFDIDTTFLIIPQVTDALPSRNLPKSELNIPRNIPLADPALNTPSEVDGLLGAEIFLQLLCIGQFTLADSSITLQKTKLGWIAAGRLPCITSQQPVHCNLARDGLQNQLAKFWELEEPSRELIISAENRACDEHYRSQVNRDPTTGRYTVRLPFKHNREPLGQSYTMALKRYYALERKLAGDSNLKNEYTKFINEYEKLGHMSQIEVTSTEEGYYLPHHAIVKQSSLTTKLRVVFDASAKTTSGVSLNNTLMVGPTIQDELLSLLIRFRSHAYVLTADIEKMYRQILIHPDDRKYQRILWRSDLRHPLKTYTLNTVTYGTSAAPFLAIRTLHQLAKDEGNKFPHAATALREDFYVDDLLTGAATYDETATIRDELIEVCKRAGFKLRQWAANDERLVETLDDRTDDDYLRLDLDETVKTLGVVWNAKQDTITYNIQELNQSRVTKRSILSQIATLFDPLGILGPIIVRAKILMQALWKLRIDWDESVPVNVYHQWSNFCIELTALNHLKIKRAIMPKETTAAQIHCFCDASEQAYGACIYLRAIDRQGHISSQLIASKSRVAPLKSITLPRLELCAAHLVSKLYQSVSESLRRLTIERVVFWSDSTIVLHWIQTAPHLLKTFVAHRITEIQDITDKHEWHHVCSSDNPADIISRGSDVHEFLTNELWHHGPSWLKIPDTQWPSSQPESLNDLPEMRPLVTLNACINQFDLLEKFSSITKLKKIVAYILRFRYNSSRKENHRGPLTTFEIRRAEQCVIKCVQHKTYKSDISVLERGQGNHKLTPLNPFLDKEGILRVGGRLSKARLRYETKHPILLPRDHDVTRSIIQDIHVKNLHAGTQATLNAVRQKFWIPSGKNSVKAIIHKCITCYRARPRIAGYKMSDLPAARVTSSRPFSRSGVDYCGPIYIKEKTHRNRNKIKVYLAIFVCFATKAVHIEIVGDLTTEAFLAALRRFMARRGRCSDIYSDNATNFVGAIRELKELYLLLQSKNNDIASILADEGIFWHLIPPRSPHFGGLWEAAVRSVKHHLTRVIGDTLLSYEALLTYVNQIEGILNSRPITPLSSDPNDLTALTPSHFLIGGSLTSIPDFDYTKIPDGRLSAWQHVQKMKDHFWKRWSKEYLQEQTTRTKWVNGKGPTLTIGTLVLIKEDHTHSMTWPLGRITAVHPGDDGVIRVVTVKTPQGEYKRCVKRIAPLPLYD